jgi:hypothetical protein
MLPDNHVSFTLSFLFLLEIPDSKPSKHASYFYCNRRLVNKHPDLQMLQKWF